jgi:hypothetical protein
MALSTGYNIRQTAMQYVAGKISLRTFEDWFTPIAWEIEKFQDPDAETLVYQIDVLLAEVSSGHRSENSLKSALVPVISNIVMGSGASKCFLIGAGSTFYSLGRTEPTWMGSGLTGESWMATDRTYFRTVCLQTESSAAHELPVDRLGRFQTKVAQPSSPPVLPQTRPPARLHCR